MAARELAAWAYLVDAERKLVEHREFVRARRDDPKGPEGQANAAEHERVTAALHRTREALGHLEGVPTVRDMLLEAQADRQRERVDVAAAINDEPRDDG